MTWPLECPDWVGDDPRFGTFVLILVKKFKTETSADELRCKFAPVAAYTACALITLCPVMAFCCFPLAEKSFYLSLMNFSLSFATSLASGSLFFLLFPSCLENREELNQENERLRHAGAIMCGMVWFFFILNRTSKMLFAKKLIDGQKRHHSVVEKETRKSGSK